MENSLCKRLWTNQKTCCWIDDWILSPSFAVSANISTVTNLHTFLSLSYSFSLWLVDGCPSCGCVFPAWDSQNELPEMSYFRDLGKAGTLGVPNRILWDTGTEPYKTHKTETVPRKKNLGDCLLQSFVALKGVWVGFEWFKVGASGCLLWTRAWILGLRSALSWVITQRRVVIPYRRFGTTCRSHIKGSRGLLDLRKWNH